RLSLAGVQLVESALQLFKLLPRLAELAFCGEALVIGEVFGSFRDKRVEVGGGPGRSAGCLCVSPRLRRQCRGAQCRDPAAKKSGHRRPTGWSIGKPLVDREEHQ